MQYDGRVRVNGLDWASLVLVIVGAVSWGLADVGNFLGSDWNLVEAIFGSIPALGSLIYVLVGLAGLYELYFAYQLYGARAERPAVERPAR